MFILPDANIYQAQKRPLMPDVVKQDEERMFEASIENWTNISSSVQLSFNWFIRNVQTSPLEISSERTLVERNSLSWSFPAGSLSTGLKLIELEVTVSNIIGRIRDFGFLKVEKPNVVAIIIAGSELLSSSKYPVGFNGLDSLDLGVNQHQHVRTQFLWYCLDGGKLPPRVFSGNNSAMVPSEGAKKHAKTCPREISFKTNRSIAYLINPLHEHVYYIRLVVLKYQRRAEFVQTVYTADEDVLRVNIR